MPDDAAAVGGLPGCPGSRDRSVDGVELLVAAHLAHDAPGVLVALEDDEVPEEIEEIAGRKEPGQGNVLGGWWAADDGG
jgi:hypothetical protein